jgi:hypothetical protein
LSSTVFKNGLRRGFLKGQGATSKTAFSGKEAYLKD